jgi:hypothetical protein
MANKKISDLAAAGNLEAGDALELSQNSTSVKMTLGDMGWNTMGITPGDMVLQGSAAVGILGSQTVVVDFSETATLGRAHAILDLDELKWNAGTVSYDLLYTGSTASTTAVTATLVSHAYSVADILSSAADLSTAASIAGSSVASNLYSHSFSGTVTVTSTHELLSVSLARSTADSYGGALRVAGIRATLSS